jgi:hypothetical protein
VGPLGAQRLEYGGQHEALDVGAGRELGAELVALDRVQRPLEEGAEDGGLDGLPIVLRRGVQAGDLVGVQLQRGGVGEEAAVEPELRSRAVILRDRALGIRSSRLRWPADLRAESTSAKRT